MVSKLLFLLPIFFVFISGCTKSDYTNDVLWYQQPAQAWEEALPMGNGRLGVMVFGKTSRERIQLNDDSMWPGDDNGWNEPDGAAKDLQKIRKLLINGKHKEADNLFIEKYSRNKVTRSHQTLGDLFIDFDHDNITDYRRELNISNSIATVSYKSNGDLITEKIFVSHLHRAVIIEFTSAAKEGLNGKVRLTRPDDNGFPTVSVKAKENNLLIMQGEVTQREAVYNSKPDPILSGVKFETVLKINNTGGKIVRNENHLLLKNVKKATFYLVSNSSFYYKDYAQQNKKDLSAIDGADFDILKTEHVKDYQNLYSRVELKLSEANLDTIPTDVRLKNIKKGNIDLGLEALLFQYGRYLLIGSSRKGSNPPNLQGLWNEHIKAPWNADYHLNINLQMNYWLSEVTNLSELNDPLFDFIDRLVENGKITAKKNFGCRGTVIPHASDLWATTWFKAVTAHSGNSIAAGGWLMHHYWDHFAFTRDTVFLRERAFPAMQENVRFYSDWIMEDPRDGKLVSAPSISYENRFINSKGEPVASCLGSAFEQQVIAESFDNYIKACQILQINDDFLDKVKRQKEKLRPGFVIGNKGEILEWDREYSEYDVKHIHISNLYGFFSGASVSNEKTPDIFKAIRKTIDTKLVKGGHVTGWSRALLIMCGARLLDGDMAHKHIRALLKKSMYHNLLDAPPPFQIDGNFGYSAGFAEMLLQSHEEDILRILPALPAVWKNGFIKGLKARGGYTVDIYWSDNILEKAVIKSKYKNNFNLMYGKKSIAVEIGAGETYTYKSEL